MDDLAEDFWDNLLEHIEEGRVIPIVGPALVTVQQDSREISLYRHTAERLAESVQVPMADMSATYTLNDVVCRFLDNRGRKEEIYRRLRLLLKDETFPPSPRLLDLARIRGFDLFVTTTFDSLLADAINTVRFGGNKRTDQIAYSPTAAKDLGSEKASLERPVVYHLLGKLSASPDYVVCDEDVLEFLSTMLTESRRPHLLFDELKNNHLLLLGCRLGDWLARFFIRIAKSQRLSRQRDQMEVLVGSELADESNLAIFLQHYSYDTRVIPGRADAFVTELARRWRVRHPEEEYQPAASVSAEPGASADQMEAGAIFVSYASDDLEAVRRIKTALEAAGLDVWFDKRELRAGDDWDQKIQRNIKNCSLLMPIVSRATEARLEGYFRREWAWAVDRALGMAEEVPFIIPVAIDELSSPETKVPERFKRTQWTQLLEGQVTAEFADRLKQLVRDYHRRQRGA
jgi:hypothetical protein